ncbi:hypothetical protein BMI86_02175 [Thioclava sp. DLFJ5-1]|uniref:Flp family type IVb pilin n=1 Tax=Thioclava sp. DLFJ5-1 TaxID=1915314 RepID=UPI000996E591|nr:hypothetical protein [Thioclava sp. DLFJ5-1]OOY21402.1 hypothetical protein BMI86_02175 [Thioclava sp. DLFJ5-1]
MKLFKLASLRRLKKDEEGVTVVEYGIALSVALGIGSAIYTGLAGDIELSMEAAGGAMPTAQPTGSYD